MNRASVGADPLHGAARSLLAQTHEPLVVGEVGQRVAALARDVLGVVGDVVAVVAVLGNLGLATSACR